MYNNNSRGTSYTAGFFMLIAFTVAALIAASLISIIVWRQMTGLGFDKMVTDMGNPAYANTMKVIQVINATVGFLLPAIVTAAILNRKPMALLGFSSNIKFNQAGLVIGITIFGLLVSSSLAYFNEQIPVPASWKITFDKWEAEYNEQINAIISLKSFTDYILALVLIAFLPALCEEALFRGGFQNFLTRSTKMPWLSIIIVSIIFSAVHVSFYGFLSRFFLGVMLGAIFHYSGKLWLSILAHFVTNGLAVTVLYVLTRQGKPATEAMQEDVTSYWGIIFLPAVIGLFIVFKRVSRNRKPDQLPVNGI
ncbi:MAG: CPBP family intramembrane glutamic endopeptidase [Chitinophagaceae bacterium]